MQYLDVLSSDDFEYLNPRGVIPNSAILKVGEQVRKSSDKKSTAATEGTGVESDDDEDLLDANNADLEG